jgi:hypothetical protein
MHDPMAPESEASIARVGVLLGAVGLFILNLVFGPIAIGLGVTAIRRGVRPALPRATALASIVLTWWSCWCLSRSRSATAG